jgi:hypothetical protein
MYARICSFIALLLAALALSECASYAPYPCPPGYHLGPYGRRCLPNVGAYYPPPPPGYGPPAGYAPNEYGPSPAPAPEYSPQPENHS